MEDWKPVVIGAAFVIIGASGLKSRKLTFALGKGALKDLTLYGRGAVLFSWSQIVGGALVVLSAVFTNIDALFAAGVLTLLGGMLISPLFSNPSLEITEPRREKPPLKQNNAGGDEVVIEVDAPD